MNNQSMSKLSYEPESDVVRIELANLPIDYAREMGNMVVHFSQDHVPVYVEILDATKFKKNLVKVFEHPAEAVPMTV